MGTAVVHRLEWVDVDVVCPCEPHAAATRMQSYGRSKLPARFSCSRVAARRTHRRRDSVATKCSVSLSVPTRRASVLVLHSLHDAARFFVRVYSLKSRGKGRLQFGIMCVINGGSKIVALQTKVFHRCPTSFHARCPSPHPARW